MSSKVSFLYSPNLEWQLSRLAGANYSHEQVSEGLAFQQEIDTYWSNYNTIISTYFSKLGAEFPSHLFVYPIHRWKNSDNNFQLSSSSFPILLEITNDLEYASLVLVHEISHFFLYWIEQVQAQYFLLEPCWTHLNKVFPNIGEEDREHVFVHILTYCALAKIYDKETLQTLYNTESKIEGSLQKAWDLITESTQDDLSWFQKNPFEVVLSI